LSLLEDGGFRSCAKAIVLNRSIDQKPIRRRTRLFIRVDQDDRDETGNADLYICSILALLRFALIHMKSFLALAGDRAVFPVVIGQLQGTP
jgi:hypothetical protein